MTPHHLGLNALFLEPRMGGVETYVRALVPELLALAPGMRITVFCNPLGRELLAGEPWAADVDIAVPPVIGRRGLRLAGELAALGHIARRRGIDLLHSTTITGPLRSPVAHVVTMHDMTWMTASDAGDNLTYRLWRASVPRVARAAQRVITDSRAIADEAVERLHVERERVDVVPLGHSAGNPAAPTPEAVLRERFELGDGPVVLTVSAKRRHKNLLRLIRAMGPVAERVPGATLVMPGNATPHEEELRAETQRLGLGDTVRLLHYVDAADLEGLYAIAGCVAYPSTSEGFGLPVLEAMRRGAPVACSNVSSLPEVAGDAVRYFDPLSETAIAQAIAEVLTDRELAARLVALGYEQQARFSWRECAKGTLESYSRALAH